MKKSTFLAVLVLLSQLVFAGGLLTNGNQSAQYIRMMSRNASLGIDAVYYNPAGLVRMEDGWHFSLSNQTIFQEKTVTNAFPLLNQAKYVGDVTVPIFPNFYAAYKTGDLVFSLGFGPNSGGGSADFKNGLPSFEIPISQLPMMMSGLGLPTTAYDAGIAFSGTSVFYGLQLNVSYALSDIISAAGGIRYISANNTYEGYFPRGINDSSSIGILSMLPVAGTLLGKKEVTEFLIPSQIRMGGEGEMENRMHLRNNCTIWQLTLNKPGM